MACHALGRCRICARKHKIPVFGGEEIQHVLIERANLKLIILNTVCITCILKIERTVKRMDLNPSFSDVMKEDEGEFDADYDQSQQRHQMIQYHVPTDAESSSHDQRSMLSNIKSVQHDQICEQVEMEGSKCNCGVCYLCSNSSGLPPLARVTDEMPSTSMLLPTRHERTFTTLEPSRRQESYHENIPQHHKSETVPHLQVPEVSVSQESARQCTTPYQTGLMHVEQGGSQPSHSHLVQSTDTPHFADCSSTSNIQGGKKNPRDLFCDFCEKKFTHAGDLNKHRRKHTGERPYECTQCQRKFAHASNLARHQRVHSGERPFSCPECGRTFTRRDKLANHIATERCRNRSSSQLHSPT